MSSDNSGADTSSICASCGIAENDDVTLKKCTACYLVRYCSVQCQKEHRPQHKRACRKRAAELRDELLFKQPESTHLGDCPTCMIPMPLDIEKMVTMPCCQKSICKGCDHANQRREYKAKLDIKCAFCRQQFPETLTERAEMKNPVALRRVGSQHYKEGDYTGACEYWSEAAKLGDVQAHYQLSLSYHNGEGVEKDKKKEIYHSEQAAIGGHPFARNNLGHFEALNGRYDRAIKHFIIAASQGDDCSMENLTQMYIRESLISNEDLAATLRAHQAAVDATKSPHREEADSYVFGQSDSESDSGSDSDSDSESEEV